MRTHKNCYAVIRNDNNVVAKLLDTSVLPDEDRENGRIVEIDAEVAAGVHVGMVYDPSDNKFISPQDSNAARERRKQERSDAATARERTETADRVARQMGGNRPEAAKDIERAEKAARGAHLVAKPEKPVDKPTPNRNLNETVGGMRIKADTQTKPETIGKQPKPAGFYDADAESRRAAEAAQKEQAEQAKRAAQRSDNKTW